MIGLWSDRNVFSRNAKSLRFSPSWKIFSQHSISECSEYLWTEISGDKHWDETKWMLRQKLLGIKVMILHFQHCCGKHSVDYSNMRVTKCTKDPRFGYFWQDRSLPKQHHWVNNKLIPSCDQTIPASSHTVKILLPNSSKGFKSSTLSRYRQHFQNQLHVRHISSTSVTALKSSQLDNIFADKRITY